MRPTVLLPLVFLLSACVLGRGGPDFKTWSKNFDLHFEGGVHRGSITSVEIVQARVLQQVSALGTQSCVTEITLRLTNHGSGPYELFPGENGREDNGLSRTLRDGQVAMSVLFFHADRRSLPPGQTQESNHQFNVGPSECGRPAELVFDGVRLPLHR